MKRRGFLIGSAAAAFAAENKPKLLLPTDIPDEHGLRIMWYSPVPPIDRDRYRLEIKGLVEKPQALPLAALRALPAVKQSSRMKCVQCWSARSEWGGFRFSSLIERVKPSPKAKAIRIDCADKWYEYLSLDEMANPRVLLALDLAGRPLPDNHGAPLRLIDPSKYGYKSAKLITAITFVEQGKGSMACDIGPYYSPTGEILPGYDTPLDLFPDAAKPGWKLDPKARRKIKGGEITEY